MSNQKGFATLTVAVLLLLVVTLTVFMGIRGSIIEQQSANNAYLTQVAFEHAEQGRALFIANIKTHLTANPSSTLSAALAAAQGTTNTSGSKYSVAYVISADGTYATLTSTGTVVGNTSRKVAQRVSFTAGGSGPAALNALGSIGLGGSTDSSSAKAGGTISGNVPNDATQNTNEFKVALLDHAGQVLKDSSGNPIMRSMTSEEYFMYYFGGLCPVAKAAYGAGDLTKAAACEAEAKISVAANPKGYVCNAADCSSKAEDDKINAAYDAGKRIFWLSNGGLDHKESLGTEADPVMIFVMNIADASKAAKINAGSTIYGVLYVDILDTKTTTNCSCYAQDSVTSVVTSPLNVQVDDTTKPIYGNDTTKPIYTGVTSGGSKCDTKDGCTDSRGITIAWKDNYTVSYQQKITGYQQKTVQQGTYTSGAAWSAITYGLNPNQVAACTVNACTASTNQCTPANTVIAATKVGDISGCSYSTPTVSGTNDTSVQIEVVGTWEAGGTGHSVVQGAVITSGNYAGTGNASYIQNSKAVTNAVSDKLGGAGFTATPAILSVSPNSWSDMD